MINPSEMNEHDNLGGTYHGLEMYVSVLNITKYIYYMSTPSLD